jgi:hypothetical protein
LVDSGGSHSFIDMRSTRTLGLVPRICGIMVITTASHRSLVLPRKQGYILPIIRGMRGSRVLIDGWYTVYDLCGSYDLVEGKNWMSMNPHTSNHSTNTLHLLEGG